MKEKLLNALKWFYQSFIWLFIVLLGLDILTKQLVMNAGVEPGHIVADWGFVHISYVLNPNAAFGLGADNPVVSRVVYLIVASLVIIGIVTYLILKRRTTKLYIRACLVLIATGALGNMIDRIFYAQTEYCVVDWIDFYWFWGYNFNIADCCIVIAAFMMIIYIIVTEVKDVIKRRNAELAEDNGRNSEKQEEKELENTDSDNK